MNHYFKLILLCLVGLSVLFLMARVVPAAPTITWRPALMSIEVGRLETKAISVSLVSSDTVTNLQFRVVPELQPILTVVPPSLSRISKGETVSLTLIFSPGAQAMVGMYQGTVQARTGNTLAKPLPVSAFVTVVPLPPDPGEAGRQTLAGIDSDGDGIRDDVQRYIALTYPYSAKTRAALGEVSRVLEGALTDADDQSSARRRAIELAQAMDCLFFVREARDAYRDALSLRDQLLNTDLRRAAAELFDSNVAGQFTRSLRDKRQGCSFTPETLEN